MSTIKYQFWRTLVIVVILAGFLPAPGVIKAAPPRQDDAEPEAVTYGLGLVHTGDVDEVTIYGGASAEDKQAKIVRAQTLLADAIFETFAHMDTCLALIALNTGLDDDAARAVLQIALADQRVLYDYDALTEQVVLTAGVDEESVRRLLDQLVAVDTTTTTLLNAPLIAETWAADKHQIYYGPLIDLSTHILQLEARLAYAEGILILNALNEADSSAWNDRLANWTQLYAGETVSIASGIRLVNQLEAARDPLLRERRDLIKAALDPGDLPADLSEAERAAALAPLTVLPVDTPEIVVNKAIFWRKLGYTADALAAFDTYAAMFAPTNPGAEQYARIARLFTQQMDALAVGWTVAGGAYLVAVAEDGSAGRAGLAAGDIVIAINGSPVQDADELWDRLQRRTVGDPVEIVYLRSDAINMLRVYETTMAGAERLGIWYILI